MDPVAKFMAERNTTIERYGSDLQLRANSKNWLSQSMQKRYVYNFDWLGRPIIQYPQDMVAMQELVWSTRPDLIIEMGIAHGGSLVLSASLLALLDMCDAVENGTMLDPSKSNRKVLGVDIDIRQHNREAIEAHPLNSRIMMIEGSSLDERVINQVQQITSDYQRVMVCLDSNHTHDHVLTELENYAHLVTKGSYCVVFDTFVEDLDVDIFPDRPWGPGDNPKTAVWKYLEAHPEFEIDKSIDNKLLISVAPDGFLRRKG